MEQMKITPLRAIRAKCMECTLDSYKEIRECTMSKCPLHQYRMGHRPKKEGDGQNGVQATGEHE